MTKAELRKIYLEKRKSLAPAEIKQKSAQLAELFFQSFNLSKIHFLHCFLPIERFNEIDTRMIFHRIWQEFPHIETLVPRVNFQKTEIENLKFTPVTELVQNAWLIDEPAHNELVESEKIDAVLVPLLCFDRRGFRAGYGKGFYDKLLKTCRQDCKKIGLSYFPPVEKIADINEFDVRLDYCLTSERVF
ncbi:MAG: 5-formyltetrahydrofolate cyclo-ligase, partial [Actinomycetota bacterium]